MQVQHEEGPAYQFRRLFVLYLHFWFKCKTLCDLHRRIHPQQTAGRRKLISRRLIKTAPCRQAPHSVMNASPLWANLEGTSKNMRGNQKKNMGLITAPEISVFHFRIF